MKRAAEDDTSIWWEYNRGEDQMLWWKDCQSQIHESSWGHECISGDTADTTSFHYFICGNSTCFVTAVAKFPICNPHTRTLAPEERQLLRSLSVHQYAATASHLIPLSSWIAAAFFTQPPFADSKIQLFFIPSQKNPASAIIVSVIVLYSEVEMPSNIIFVEIKWAVILFLAKIILTVSIKTLHGVAINKSVYWRMDKNEEGGKHWRRGTLQVKQNWAFTWSHFVKIDHLLPSLYVTSLSPLSLSL